MVIRQRTLEKTNFKRGKLRMTKSGLIKNSKKMLFFLAGVGVMLLAGCGRTKPTVQISLWSDERNVQMLSDALEEFKELYKDEANFEFTISMEGEDTCKETVLSNPEGAADIYTFADDQMEELYQHGVLLEITDQVDDVLNEVGGEQSGAARAAMRDGKLYAYPETAGNGYFLYYNKAYFSKEDVETLDRILEIAQQNNKKFTMDYSSGWYLYSFFKGAGLELNCEDGGKTNICNWNATDTPYKGIDVAKSMETVANSEGFISLGDDGFLENVENGTVIAGINGPWNAERVKAAWGDDYAACKLPTYTINGNQEQMNSFAGYKLLGINVHTEKPEYCMMVAKFLTNKENQLKRFEQTGECPANLEAAQTEEVQESPAIAALAAQSQYGNVQSVADPFWEAAKKFGVTLVAGNPGNRDLQELLDEMQQEIVTPSALKEKEE